MTHSHLWLGLSVQEFLGQANWDGQLAQRRKNHTARPAIAVGTLTDWGRLSVQAFFKANNWMGQPLDFESVSSSEDQFIPAYTAAVRDYFQYLPWEGQPAIAQSPQITPKSSRLNQVHPEDNLTLVDLSDLF